MSVAGISYELLHKYNVQGPRYTSYPPAPSWKNEIGPTEYEAHIKESNGILYNNDTKTIQATTTNTSTQFLITNNSKIPTFISINNNILISNTNITTIQTNSITLTTNTTKNYITSTTTNKKINPNQN
jgi:hypothetical protein